jgi:hypothetical protein
MAIPVGPLVTRTTSAMQESKLAAPDEAQRRIELLKSKRLS